MVSTQLCWLVFFHFSLRGNSDFQSKSYHVSSENTYILVDQIISTQTYTCNTTDRMASFSLSFSSHSVWDSRINCSLDLCNRNSYGNVRCHNASTPCFRYQNSHGNQYCAHAILCSILQPCNNSHYSCTSINGRCVVNSCCSPHQVCSPLSWTSFCEHGR